MAYGLIYTVKFKNRILNDIYSAEIYKKDYAGAVTDLQGADTPLTLELDDTDILNPIRGTQLTISFLNGGLKIEDFYSDDDEAFLIKFYFVSTAAGTGIKTLLFSGYMVQDSSSEPDTDRKHYITIKATDNLALLKSFTWSDTDTTADDLYNKFALGYYLQLSLRKTGMGLSSAPEALHIRRYLNLFENTMQDRGDNILAEGLYLCNLHSNMFQTDTETWDDLYSIIETILRNLNASLVQAGGVWNIYREPEFSYFTGGIIPGVESYYVGSIVNHVAAATNPVVTIRESGGDVYPITEDLTKYIARPLRQVINTFEYNNPDSYIIQDDLQIPADAVPYSTTTSGGYRYESFAIDTYFPDWKRTHSDTSYMVRKTEIATETETERYIVTPGATSEQRGVQLNPVEVTKGDVFDFTMQYRMDVTDTDGSFNVFVRFILISDTGKSWHLEKPVGISDADPSVLLWDEHLGTEWDSNFGVYMRLNLGDIETMEWREYSLNAMIDPEIGPKMPPFPESGMLLIEVRGTNGLDGMERQTTWWKDPAVTITNFLNDTTIITGHEHKTTGNPDIKAEQKNDIEIDDAPRSTIAGALYTDAVTNFNYTDSTFGTTPDIPPQYFTRTENWHRGGNSEALRFGDILTRERLQMLYTSRYVSRGDF